MNAAAAVLLWLLLLSGCFNISNDDLPPSGGDSDDSSPTPVADADGDGYASLEDCDDQDPGVYPGAPEACDDVDSDCDGQPDDADASDAATWYADTDEDGFGDAAATTVACAAPVGYVADASDCDDSSAVANPDGVEVCDDGVDNDCDGYIDQSDALSWYLDFDGDGYGDPEHVQLACVPPAGYVSDATDCEDLDAAIHPGADELCDSIDNDCDGGIDDHAIDADVWYRDADGDGFGNPDESVATCDRPDGYLADASDCDDQDPAVNPAALEVCDPANTDEDCDGEIDDDDNSVATDTKTPHYPDADADGYGAAGSSQGLLLCDPVPGYAADTSDCDDTDAAIYPDAVELANGLDDDCDGTIDEGTSAYDDDRDSFTEAAGDCDDENAAVHPDAQEQCNGVDDDCSGLEDDLDADGDGHWPLACGGNDCDDGDSSLYPGAPEDGGDGSGEPNGVDDDCDGRIDEALPGTDDDGDGFTELEGDCDDAAATAYPGAPERFDALDNDCDGTVRTAFRLSDAPASWGAAQAGAWAGLSVAVVPDVNGDGYADLVVGAPHHDPTAQQTGAAFLIFGRASGWEAGASLEAEITYVADQPYAEAGWSVSSAGDYNHDGLGDFAVGAPGYPSGGYPRAGAAYLFAGAPSGWASEALGLRSSQLFDPADPDKGTLGSSVYGIYDDVELGYALAGGGDVNGDSRDDLLIGGPCRRTSAACASATGWLMVLPGASQLDQEGTLSDVAKLQGDSQAAIGYSVAIIGRADNDNYADMLVGGPASSEDEGMAIRLRGSASIKSNALIPDTDALAYTGDSSGEWVGQSMAGVGDVNGDHLDDYLLGRKLLNEDLELAYLFYGGALESQPSSGTASSSAPATFIGTETDACPCTVTGLGDLDRDGLDDFAIGAAGNSEAASGAGKVYLFFGRSGGFSGDIPITDADFTISGEVSGDTAGAALSGGQDLNGDGYPDFVIAAPYRDGEQADSGAVYVFFGFPR